MVRKLDIVVVKMVNKVFVILDIATPGDARVNEKKNKIVEKYLELKSKIKRSSTPVIVGYYEVGHYSSSKFHAKI